MTLALRSFYKIATLAIFLLGSCKNGCIKKEMPASSLSEFADLDLEGLSKEQCQSFTKLLQDEISPCGCPNTFAQCLSKKECDAAKLLAAWALGNLKNNAPERAVFQALSDEINKGYMSEPIKVNTTYAHHKGLKNAPITIIEFADFECPACKIASKSLAKILSEHTDIQVYFLHLPLTTHPYAEAAAVAAEAAALQNKFWPMHDKLFAYEGPLSESAIHEVAASIFSPKELIQFEKNIKDESLLQKVRTQREYALNELKLTSTPTFLFNGRPYNLSLAEDGFLARIAMEKARDHHKCESAKNAPNS